MDTGQGGFDLRHIWEAHTGNWDEMTRDGWAIGHGWVVGYKVDTASTAL